MKKESENQAVTEKTAKIIRLENCINKLYKIRINEITQEVEYKNKTSNEFEVLNIPNLYYDLYLEGFTKFKEEINVLLNSSRFDRFDPIKNYFESLGAYSSSEKDYILELASYVKTDSQELFYTVFKKFIVQVVAQSMGHISFNKHCLTFVGNQHDGKTYFLDYLTPNNLKKYVKKGYEFNGGKESKLSLVQNFIINLDELASFSKKELNNEFKSVLSESIVRFRPLYSNQEVSFSRRASFVASTNQTEFLTDETGNVRWLVFKIDKINHDNGGQNGYSSISIDNVYRQAYHLLKSSFQYYFTDEEIIQIEANNKKYMKTSDEMELIQKLFKSPSHCTPDTSDFYQTTDIVSFLLVNGLKTTRTFVGKALKILGYEISKKYNKEKGYTESGYYLSKYTL